MTTEIAVPTNDLATKMDYARAMAGSNLLPKSYQGNPANLLFALEYAEALGVEPIHAITSIHVINGKPSASADLMSATVRRAGHKLRVTGDDTYAEAVLIRADDPDFEFRARWDVAKARQANLNTPTWKNYPGAMLRSRAITEVIRAGAPDAMFGLVYTPEELGVSVDGEGKPVQKPVQYGQPEPVQGSRIQAAMKKAQPEMISDIEDLGETVLMPPQDWDVAIAECEGDEARLRLLYNEAAAFDAGASVLVRIRAAVVPPEAVS